MNDKIDKLDDYKRPWRVHKIGPLVDLLDRDNCIILTGDEPGAEALFVLVCQTVNGKEFNYGS